MKPQDIITLIELIRPENNITLMPKQLLHTLEAPMNNRDFRDIFKQVMEFMDFSISGNV